MCGEGKKMNEAAIDKRFHLDGEIRELLAFAFEQYGMDGIKYTKQEIDRLATMIEQEEDSKKIFNQ